MDIERKRKKKCHTLEYKVHLRISDIIICYPNQIFKQKEEHDVKRIGKKTAKLTALTPPFKSSIK